MFSRRAAFSALGLALLGATLGLKALVSDFRTMPDFARFDAALAAILERQRFAVTRVDRPYDQTFLVARRGGCTMVVRGEIRGDYGDGFRRQTAAFGPLAYSYSYRGAGRPTFPVTAFFLSEYADRAATRLGMTRPTAVPIAIGATAGCPLERIDFGPALIYPRG